MAIARAHGRPFTRFFRRAGRSSPCAAVRSSFAPALRQAPCLVACVLIACGAPENRETLHEAPLQGSGGGKTGAYNYQIHRLPGFRGLSGLTADSRGRLWAAAERDRVLVRLELTPAGIRTRVFPRRGLTIGLDAEALAFTSANSFLLGTEHRWLPSANDALIPVRLNGERFEVGDRLRLDYGLWKTRANRNQGIEGLCAWRGRKQRGLIAVSETIQVREGRRLALMALGMRRAEHEIPRWTPLYFPLTTTVGKPAGLHCRWGPSGLEALLIERHYGARRLLSFRVPDPNRPRLEKIRVLLNLDEIMKHPGLSERESRRFNPEGIARLAQGTIAVIGDNSAADTATLLVLISGLD